MLLNSFGLQKSLVPTLPEDLAISFYIQSHKLVLAVYHLSTVHGNIKFDTFQAECSVPWISEVLVLFTVALQLCQQLKDKVRFICFSLFLQTYRLAFLKALEIRNDINFHFRLQICVFSQYKDFSATGTNTAAVAW